MKFFLLIAGDTYYPACTDDWIGTYATREEARAEIEIKVTVYKDPAGLRGDYEDKKIYCKGEKVDWYEIIDLRDWIMDDNENVSE